MHDLRPKHQKEGLFIGHKQNGETTLFTSVCPGRNRLLWDVMKSDWAHSALFFCDLRSHFSKKCFFMALFCWLAGTLAFSASSFGTDLEIWSYCAIWKKVVVSKRRDQEPNGHLGWAPEVLCADGGRFQNVYRQCSVPSIWDVKSWGYKPLRKCFSWVKGIKIGFFFFFLNKHTSELHQKAETKSSENLQVCP